MSNHINIGRLSDFVARSPLRLGRSVQQFGCSIPVSNSSFVVLMVGRATALLHHPPLLSRTPPHYSASVCCCHWAFGEILDQHRRGNTQPQFCNRKPDPRLHRASDLEDPRCFCTCFAELSPRSLSLSAAVVHSMAKRQRLDIDEATLQQVLHTGRISQAGLAKLLSKLQDKSQGSSSCETVRKQLLLANTAKFATHRLALPLQLSDGSPWAWHLLDPGKTLASILATSASLQALYTVAWRRSPATPASLWRIVVGFDEFTPGNKLSLDQSRKCMVVSFSFLELGQAALSRGRVWVTVACVRTNMIKQVS